MVENLADLAGQVYEAQIMMYVGTCMDFSQAG